MFGSFERLCREDATAAPLTVFSEEGVREIEPQARPAAWEAATGRRSFRREVSFFFLLRVGSRKVDGMDGIFRQSGLGVREVDLVEVCDVVLAVVGRFGDDG